MKKGGQVSLCRSGANGLPQAQIEGMRITAFLHDIGKIVCRRRSFPNQPAQ